MKNILGEQIQYFVALAMLRQANWQILVSMISSVLATRALFRAQRIGYQKDQITRLLYS
tara:strand:- start:2090 stop:2266 length:177 start_codon:yes stop_codon:yes gene_type:complete